MDKKKLFIATAIATVLVVLIGAIIVGVACSDTAEPMAKKLTLEDIDRIPRRPSVLCLSPSFVEIMYRINREDHIIAVTEGCDFPSDAKTLPNLGSSIDLDWELVEQLPIDVVMLTPSHKIEHARFAKLGKKVIVGDVVSLDSVINTIWTIGLLFNEEDFVEQWMMELDLALTVLKKKSVARDARGEEAPKVLFVLGHEEDFSGKIIVAGARLFYGDVIVKAGGVNAFQGAVETAAITFEELVALKPDIVIDVVPPVDLFQRLEYESKIKSSWEERLGKDEKNQQPIKVEVFSESWARRPGPRVIELINNVGKIVFQ